MTPIQALKEALNLGRLDYERFDEMPDHADRAELAAMLERHGKCLHDDGEGYAVVDTRRNP